MGKRGAEDFDWYRRQVDAFRQQMQEGRPGVVISDDLVVRKHGADLASQLSDAGIAQVLEHSEGPGPNWRRFRGILRAEKARRDAAGARSMFRLGFWALIVALVATAIAGASLVVQVASSAG